MGWGTLRAATEAATGGLEGCGLRVIVWGEADACGRMDSDVACDEQQSRAHMAADSVQVCIDWVLFDQPKSLVFVLFSVCVLLLLLLYKKQQNRRHTGAVPTAVCR